MEYKNGVLDAIYHSEGRVTKPTSSTYRYEYTLKDHLGNGRVYFTDINNDNTINETDILQEQNYYAFGASFDIDPWYGSSTTKNKYQYNGKELNDDFGLNLNDYGARWYDANIGRWTSVDPLAELDLDNSPFNYVVNNPIGYIDPDGMTKEDWVRGAGGKVFWDPTVENGRQAADKNLEYLGKEIDIVDDKTGNRYLGDNTGHLSELLPEVTVTANRNTPMTDGQYASNISDVFGSSGSFAFLSATVIETVFSAGAAPAAEVASNTIIRGKIVQELAENTSNKGAAAIVGGQLPNGSRAIMSSGKIPGKIAPQLAKEAKKIGGVGAKRAGNTVGCCAEFRLGNELLLENKNYLPKDIKFTPAIRPRTGEIIPACKNCQDIFKIKN